MLNAINKMMLIDKESCLNNVNIFFVTSHFIFLDSFWRNQQTHSTLRNIKVIDRSNWKIVSFFPSKTHLLSSPL